MREAKRAQRGDHRRLRRKFHGLRPVIAMAEARACPGDADEAAEIELQAHARQHLEREVEEVGGSHGTKHRDEA
jgi:hypothetical protein